MGIVNLTPDSFSDGGRKLSVQQAIDCAHELVEAGADIIDLGAESTRPGATAVPPDLELERLQPVLAALTDVGAALSVDTRHTETMREVLRGPVDLINDVNALQAPGAVEVVAASQVGVCVMHRQGSPATMQVAPVYRSVVTEVSDFLYGRLAVLRSQGVTNERLMVDPGIGFGKNLAHNLALLEQIRLLGARCGCPVLIGLSRKSMLGELTGRPVQERLGASLGGALAAVANGARIVRVHDVAATRDALTVFTAIHSK